MANMIKLQGLGRSFGDFRALNDLTLEVNKGETLGIMGASGAGKTTLLRCVAGLDHGYEGTITLGGQDAAVYLRKNRAAMVFQHYTNFHWMTVRRNLAEANRRSDPKDSSVSRQVDEVLTSVGLAEFGDRYIAALSGGMQQRVALARALLQESDIILLDEPFGALDIITRRRLQDFVKKEFRRRGKTTLFVTHDPSEALYVSDRVIVMYPQSSCEVFVSPARGTLNQQVKLMPTFVETQDRIIRGMSDHGGGDQC